MNAGLQFFKVGGFVRDQLLGIDSKDIDFTVVVPGATTVEEGFSSMETWMRDNNFSIFLSTPDCFTIRAKFPKSHQNAGLVADFVLARKEVGYNPDSRRPILEIGNLFDDLIRRDFTVNAMAIDSNGDLIDPFNGKEDLLTHKILRTPLPSQKTMEDDPLRLLRALRFSITKNLDIDPEIWECISTQLVWKFSKTISKERIREELLKMFSHSTPKALEMMGKLQLLSPELTNVLFDSVWLKPTTETK